MNAYEQQLCDINEAKMRMKDQRIEDLAEQLREQRKDNWVVAAFVFCWGLTIGGVIVGVFL